MTSGKVFSYHWQFPCSSHSLRHFFLRHQNTRSEKINANKAQKKVNKTFAMHRRQKFFSAPCHSTRTQNCFFTFGFPLTQLCSGKFARKKNIFLASHKLKVEHCEKGQFWLFEFAMMTKWQKFGSAVVQLTVLGFIFLVTLDVEQI